MLGRTFGGQNEPKANERHADLRRSSVGPVLNPTAVETPHFFREVGALGTMRNGGAEIFLPLRTSGAGAERMGAPGHPGREVDGWMRGW